MTSEAAVPLGQLSPFEQLSYAREIIQIEGQALEKLATRLDMDFCRATAYLVNCRGSVVITGMGKAGLIGQKISATLASTGTRSIFLHPAEAVHGDLGRVSEDDIVLARKVARPKRSTAIAGSGWCRSSQPRAPAPGGCHQRRRWTLRARHRLRCLPRRYRLATRCDAVTTIFDSSSPACAPAQQRRLGDVDGHCVSG
jgi:hypothetical protein